MICEICKRKIESNESMFEIGEHDTVCYECATKMAVDAHNENREVEVTQAGNFETWKLCRGCDELFPESELREEKDMGNLCDQCINGFTSRGEELFLKF